MINTRKVIGILGGICSGKSAVASCFAALGCKVIDADRIAHEVLLDGRIKSRIKSVFGSEVFDSDGQVSRTKLATIVFADPGKVDIINGIIHPPVLAVCEGLMADYSHQPDVKAIILDMPLLLEVRWDSRCDVLVFVDTPESVRLSLASGQGSDVAYSAEQLKKREKFQISLDRKSRIADYIISNNSGLSVLAEQVARIFTDIMSR